MTKDNIIAMLRKAAGYVSGEEISRALGISRAAVNSAVQSLRKEGYDILSSTNKGYFLRGGPNIISTGELLAHLPPERVDNIICLDRVDSTNNYLKMHSSGMREGAVVVANEQTGGRGRLGRSFSSPKDTGIYMSMLMRPSTAPAETANITAWVAVAICNAIEEVCGVRPGIKWVNDLVIGGKKVCGILTEMSIEGETGRVEQVICGVGINVNERAFPDEIADIATSLSLVTGSEISRASLFCEMVRQLDKLCSDWQKSKSEYLDSYRKGCVILGKEVRFSLNGEDLTGVADDIDDNFGLVVRLPDGSRKTLIGGEVSVRGLYGYV